MATSDPAWVQARRSGAAGAGRRSPQLPGVLIPDRQPQSATRGNSGRDPIPDVTVRRSAESDRLRCERLHPAPDLIDAIRLADTLWPDRNRGETWKRGAESSTTGR